MKYELGAKIMKEFVGLTAKTYNYVTHITIMKVKKQKVQRICHKKKS